MLSSSDDNRRPVDPDPYLHMNSLELITALKTEKALRLARNDIPDEENLICGRCNQRGHRDARSSMCPMNYRNRADRIDTPRVTKRQQSDLQKAATKRQKALGSKNLQQQQRNPHAAPCPTCIKHNVYDQQEPHSTTSSRKCPYNTLDFEQLRFQQFGTHYAHATRKVSLNKLLKLSGQERDRFVGGTKSLVDYTREVGIKAQMFLNYYFLRQLEHDHPAPVTAVDRPMFTADTIFEGNLYKTGDIVSSGNMIVLGNLTATGRIQCSVSVDAQGDVISHGSINVQQNIICGGLLRAQGLVTVGSSMNVGGGVTAMAHTSVGKGIVCQQHFTTHGIVRCGGSIIIGGDFKSMELATVECGSSMMVSGDVVSLGTIIVDGDMVIGKDFSATADLIVKGYLTINGNITSTRNIFYGKGFKVSPTTITSVQGAIRLAPVTAPVTAPTPAPATTSAPVTVPTSVPFTTPIPAPVTTPVTTPALLLLLPLILLP